MERKNTATKGFAVLSAAGIINKVLSVIYIPLLLQIVGDLGYGIYSAGYRIYVFIYILTNSGFPIAISKLQAELIAQQNYRDARRSFKIIKAVMTLYGLIMTVLTIIFASQITQALHYERSYLVILALAPTMLFTALSSTYRGFFNGSSYMTPTAMSQIVEQFLNVVLSLLFAYLLLPYGIEAACAGATVGTTVGALGSAMYLKSKHKDIWKFLKKKTPENIPTIQAKDIVKRFLSYAVPIAINSIVINAGDLIDLWNTKICLLAAGFASDAADIKYGVLSKYNQILNVPLAITAALYVAIMPSFSAAVALKDNKLLKKHISDTFKITFLVSIPAAVGLTVLSRPVFMLLFSQKYLDGWNLMTVGAIVIILASVVQIQTSILQAINRTGLSTLAMLAGISVKIVINYILISIPSINILGAVIGTIVSLTIPIYLNSRSLRKYLPVEVVIRKHLGRPIIASAIMGIVVGGVYTLLMLVLQFIPSVYLVNAFSTVIAIIIGAAIYGFIMLKIGGISREDLETIPYISKLKRFIPSFLISAIRPK